MRLSSSVKSMEGGLVIYTPFISCCSQKSVIQVFTNICKFYIINFAISNSKYSPFATEFF